MEFIRAFENLTRNDVKIAGGKGEYLLTEMERTPQG